MAEVIHLVMSNIEINTFIMCYGPILLALQLAYFAVKWEELQNLSKKKRNK